VRVQHLLEHFETRPIVKTIRQQQNKSQLKAQPISPTVHPSNITFADATGGFFDSNSSSTLLTNEAVNCRGVELHG
jgi:hypothetical protein